MADTTRATIESSIRECASHWRWVERARRLLAPTFPLGDGSLDALSERNVELIDQMIYRFTKLQDSMARRLLPAIHALLEGTTEPVPFLDILHRLEAIGIIASAEKWQVLRNLRNYLAHDYPESATQTTVTLNQLYDELPELGRMYQRIAADFRRRFPTDGEP